MSVRDKRRPPFAWVTLDALRTIRHELPASRQAYARNALLALAEAASRRRDGKHEHGDVLRELASLAGVSERRLREHLGDLAAIGLVSVQAPRDERGRDLPKIYTLRDAAWSDETSGYPDGLRSDPPDGTSAPTRARLKAVKQEEEQEPPNPPRAGGDAAPSKPDGYRAHGRKREQDREYDAALRAFVAEHFPGAPIGLIEQRVSALRASHIEPTATELRPWVEKWHGAREEAA